MEENNNNQIMNGISQNSNNNHHEIGQQVIGNSGFNQRVQQQIQSQNLNRQVIEQQMQSQSMNQQGMQLNLQDGNDDQHSTKKTKLNNKIFIVLGIVLVVGLIIGIFIFSNENNNENINNDDSSNVSNNLGDNGDKDVVTVATIGHIDHGKTTLTSALTKFYGDYITVDKLKYGVEERKRGITINTTRVEYESANRHYVHYDFPYHIDYVKKIISGDTKLDGAILVVSATDGPMAQTREHLELIQKVGVSKIVVYISKYDLVDDKELVDLVEMEIRDLISQYGFDENNTPIIRGSALNAIKGDKKEEENIHDLVSAMDSWIPTSIEDINKPFLMSIEDVFTVTGRGIVATGLIERGKVKIGDTVQVIGLNNEILTTEVIDIEIFREEKEEVEAGDNVGIYLKNITKEQIQRGQVLAQPDSIVSSTKFDAEVYFSMKEEGGIDSSFNDADSLQFYFRTTNITGVIDLDDNKNIVNPGEYVTLTSTLENNVAMEVGTEFSIKFDGKTVGIGIVTKVY